MAKRRGKSTKNDTGTATTAAAAVSHTSSSSVTGVVAVSPHMEVCRLCGIPEGPFLDIFDPEKIKIKIQQLMPFEVSENDELPRKICFRCSAKVEELYEFLEKCIKTDQQLQATKKKADPIPEAVTPEINKKEQVNTCPVKTMDLCEVYIKRAVANLKPPVKHDNFDTQQVQISSKQVAENTTDQIGMGSSMPDLSRKLTRSSRSNVAEPLLEGLDDPKPKRKKSSILPKTLTIDAKPTEPPGSIFDSKNTQIVSEVSKITKDDDDKVGHKSGKKTPNVISLPPGQTSESKPKDDKIPEKAFDIMDHISTIQVNGVGQLFQCKLCNRNFYELETVKKHGCAKSGVAPPAQFFQIAQPPQPPKPPTVQYINTKKDNKVKNTSENLDLSINSNICHKTEENKKGETEIIAEKVKPKPKSRRASVAKRESINSAAEKIITSSADKEKRQYMEPAVEMVVHPVSHASCTSTILKPTAPTANSVYKLVPGSKNTYTLVEEQPRQNNSSNSDDSRPKITKRLNIRRQSVKIPANSDYPKPTPNMMQQLEVDHSAHIPVKKHNSDDSKPKATMRPFMRRKSVTDNSVKQPPMRRKSMAASKHPVQYISDDDDDDDVMFLQNHVPNSNPYPIGMYQSVPHDANKSILPKPVQIPVFGVPESEKHTYTIIKTDNPNRVLISSKPQIPQHEAPQPPASKSAINLNSASRQTQLVHAPSTSGYAGNWQYPNINSHPSHYGKPLGVKKTQISTPLKQTSQSSNFLEIKQDYKCTICPEKFSREKKLHAHIKAHSTNLNID